MEVFDCLEFTPEQIEELIDRIEKKCLVEEDYSVLASLIKAVDWLDLSLQGKKINAQYLRKVFSIKMESAKKLLKIVGKADEI